MEKSRSISTRKLVLIAGAILLYKYRPQNMARPAKRPSEHLSPSGTLRVGVVRKLTAEQSYPPSPP